MLYEGYYPFVRILIVGVLAYACAVLLIRISGKRLLSKMNAFDLVVTVAIGSTLATILLSSSIPLFEGVFALALLVGLQYLVAWSAVRSSVIRKIIKAQPAMLVYKGAFLEESMKRERVTRDEVLSAVRSQGLGRLEDVRAIVLETDGTFSVLKSEPDDRVVSNVRSVPERDG
jgi:uncharacterized membrane protein YcaP (DUF421 family)